MSEQAVQETLALTEAAMLRITHEGLATRDLRVAFERFHREMVRVLGQALTKREETG